jgi:hypothetical protein
MKRKFSLLGLSAGALLAGSTLALSAASLETLQGAWIADGGNCEQMFVKSGGRLHFKDRHAITTLGMIVSGKKFLGANASCVAHRVVPKGEHLSIGLRCSDAVIFADLSLSLKFIDATHFVRTDPLFPENTYSYHKCAM